MDQGVELEDAHGSLPGRRWLGRDRRSNQEDINELLDEAIAVLSIAPVQRYRDRVRELEAGMAMERARIAEYRRRRISAPSESLWSKTDQDYEEKIERSQSELRRLDQELEGVKREFASELRQLGLDIDEEQLDFLLSTVVGDDLLNMAIAFDNVKAITLREQPGVKS